MADNLKKIGAVITLDGEKEYKAKLKSITKEQSVLRSEMKLATATFGENAQSIEALTRKGEILEKQHQSQEERVATLKGALQDAAAQYGENSDKVKDWQIQINNAEAGLRKLEEEIRGNQEQLEGLSGDLGNAAEEADNSGESFSAFGDVLKANLASAAIIASAKTLANGIKDITTQAVGLGVSGRKALNQFAASTGTAKKDLGGFRDVMYDVYADNFGGSMEEIAEYMGEISRQMGDMDPEAMKEMTENAIAMSDTFGYDVKEQLRAVNMMMQQFGITGEEAYNLIVQGAQSGLDKNGDLLDTINEYSVHFEQLGFGAEDMFNILSNGAQSGTFSVDKLGDAMKEFGIRAKDGSDTSREAFEALGLDADEMFAAFSKGGDTAKEATQTVIEKLSEMEPGVAQTTAGVNLFGTMWEDLGVKGITSLGNINGSISTASTALADLNAVKYDDLGSAMDAITNGALARFAQGFDTASEGATTSLGNIATEVKDGEIGESLESLGTSAGELVTSLANIGEAVLPGIVKGVADIIGGAADVIKWAVDGIDKPESDLEKFIEDVKEANKDISEAIDNAKKTNDDAVIDKGKLDAYKDSLLELNEAEDKSEYTKYKIRNIVDILSGDIPELAEAYDEQTGSINLTNEEIKQLIENQEKLIMQNAAMEAREELYKALFDAQMNAVKAQNAVEEAESAYNSLLQANNETLEENAGLFGSYDGAVHSAYLTLLDAQDAQEKSNLTLQEAQKELDETDKVLEELGYTQEAVTETTKELEQEQTGQKEATEELIEETDALSESLAAYAAKTGETAEAVREKFDSLAESYANTYNSAHESIMNQLSLYDQWSGGAEITAADILSNLASQAEGMEQYAANLDTICSAVVTGIAENGEEATAQLDAGFIQYLKDMGPEAANLVATLAEEFSAGNVQLVNDLNENWQKYYNVADIMAAENAESESQFLAYAEALGVDAETLAATLKEKGVELGSGYTSSVSTSLADGQPGVDEKLNALKDKAVEKAAEYAETGSASASEYIDKMSSGIGGATFKIGTALLLISGELLLFDLSMKGFGTSSATGFMDNMESGLQDGMPGVTTQFDAIKASAKTLKDAVGASGIYAADGLVNGFVGRMNARYGEVAAAAARIQAVVNRSLQIHSPSKLLEESGEFTGEGLMIGTIKSIEAGLPNIEEAAKKINDTVASTMDIGKATLPDVYLPDSVMGSTQGTMPAEEKERSNELIGSILSILDVIERNTAAPQLLDMETMTELISNRMYDRDITVRRGAR